MPLPRQYDAFWKAVKHATGITNFSVCKALRDQKRLEMKDFIPDKGKEMERFSEFFGAWSSKKKDAMLKECWEDRLELAVEEHIAYDSDYSKMFFCDPRAAGRRYHRTAEVP
jgi:hypothetical protein